MARQRQSRPGAGFASLTPEERVAISRKGGRAAHQKGTAYQWTAEQARDAARKSVEARRARQATEEKP